jgi:hypothetical protein
MAVRSWYLGGGPRSDSDDGERGGAVAGQHQPTATSPLPPAHCHQPTATQNAPAHCHQPTATQNAPVHPPSTFPTHSRRTYVPGWLACLLAVQLNVMEPVIAFSLLTSLRLLTRGYKTLRERCVVGITANEEECRDMVNNSIGIVTGESIAR